MNSSKGEISSPKRLKETEMSHTHCLSNTKLTWLGAAGMILMLALGWAGNQHAHAATNAEYVPLEGGKHYFIKEGRVVTIHNGDRCSVAIVVMEMNDEMTRVSEYLSDSFIELAEDKLVMVAASGDMSGTPAIVVLCKYGDLLVKSSFEEFHFPK